MSDSKVKATVTTIFILDGGNLAMDGTVMTPRTSQRNVYTRRDGSHYIISLGCREDVFLQEDGTFINYIIGHTVGGGVAV